MNILPDDIELMVKYLGRDSPDIHRLIRAYLHDPQIEETVRVILRRRCLREGLDPDDPPVFWPVRKLKKGFISIGRVNQGNLPGPTFALPRDIITQHLGIFGHNGTGKSVLIMHIVLEALRAGQQVWILDIEDEYSRLAKYISYEKLIAPGYDQLKLNFFQPPGPWVTPISWLEEINLLLRGNTFLRDGSLNLFRRGMKTLFERRGIFNGKTDWPSLSEVIKYFENSGFGPKSRNIGFWESLLNRLNMLVDTFNQSLHITNSDMLTNLANRPVIFRLHRLTGVPLQFFVSFLLLWLARYREGVQDDTAHIVVIEEAHMLVSDTSRMDIGESILCRTFRTARKRNISLILCDQVPSELPHPVLANLGCRVVMRLVNTKCIYAVQSSMGLNRDQACAFSELQPRQAVVQYGLHPTPFMIQIPVMSFTQDEDSRILQQRTQTIL